MDPGTPTGREEINSYEGEGAGLRRAVGGDVVAAHDAEVDRQIVAIAVAVGGAPRQVGEGHDALEVGDRARLDVEPHQSARSRARREDVSAPGDRDGLGVGGTAYGGAGDHARE